MAFWLLWIGAVFSFSDNFTLYSNIYIHIYTHIHVLHYIRIKIYEIFIHDLQTMILNAWGPLIFLIVFSNSSCGNDGVSWCKLFPLLPSTSGYIHTYMHTYIDIYIHLRLHRVSAPDWIEWNSDQIRPNIAPAVGFLEGRHDTQPHSIKSKLFSPLNEWVWNSAAPRN